MQSSREVGFEGRVARYNGGLFWIYKQRVVTLVVLADLDEAWRPSEDVFRLADFESRLRFPVCKLVHEVDHQWGSDHSLPVQVARAQIAALRTAGEPEGRYRAKWQLVRNLYRLGYNADELREIFRLIDWMMRLPEDLGQKFERELIALEESLRMPYVTSVEQIAEARGKAKGKAEGKAEGKVEGGAAVLLRLLAKAYGPLSPEFQQRIRQLPIERQETLAESIVDLHSLEAVRAWLDAQYESPC
ncbi:MAG: DUF4351 domain-containing protein [Pirellulales bacterium]|nr:DUF4351 domain-containing protein [Pirellulales bacterium]